MKMQSQFENFAAELRAQYPDGRVEINSFPSGDQMLSFWWRGRFWVLDSLVSHNEFGVDEVRVGDGYGIGYEHVFSDFESAQQKLLSLLSAVNGEGATVVGLG